MDRRMIGIRLVTQFRTVRLVTRLTVETRFRGDCIRMTTVTPDKISDNNNHTGSNPVLTTKNKIIINMKKYHLTILRNGEYVTIFGEMSSIENFLLIEKELGYDTHILYSREL